MDKVIVFANRKDQVKRLYHKLRQAHKIVMLSGDVIQQKREKYLQIPTLQEYILIEQGIAEIEVVCRSQNWQSHFYYLGDHITLNSIGLSISVEDIYDRVKNEDVVTWLEKKARAEQNLSN